MIAPLTADDVTLAVERRNPPRIPMIQAKWWGEGLREQYGARLQEFDRFPDDVCMLWIDAVDVRSMGLSWELPTGTAHDAAVVIDDWAKLDEFIEKLPNPESDYPFSLLAERAEAAHKQDRYVMLAWWQLFFERPWSLRGMENLLLDYYLNPDPVHRLHDALCTHYEALLRRAVSELSPHGFWTSDDLGHQTQPTMRPETFDELIRPYYHRMGKVVDDLDVHWWLHSCGNNTPLLPALIDAGVDVFHPVQKHTMDEQAVAREFGDQITFLAGIDVQHTLQEKDEEGVREEVRFLIDTFDGPGGGMCIGAGNGIVSGTPFANIEAFLEEAVRYGQDHRSRIA
jgi:uroporphyrinogen decarboxylase